MRECACNCGEPAARNSRYATGHYHYWAVIRGKFRALRHYAFSRGIPFAIDEYDVAELFGDQWSDLNGIAMRRINPERGFVRENLRLGKGRRAGPESDALLRKRLAKFIRRREVGHDLTVGELEEVYRAQRKRCWLTGRRLRSNLGTKHPHALTIVKIDPGKGFERTNIRLVVRAVALLLPWGEDFVVALARNIVTVTDGRSAEGTCEPPPSRSA